MKKGSFKKKMKKRDSSKSFAKKKNTNRRNIRESQ